MLVHQQLDDPAGAAAFEPELADDLVSRGRLQPERAIAFLERRPDSCLLVAQRDGALMGADDILFDGELADEARSSRTARKTSGDAPRSARPFSSSLAMPFARGSAA